MATYDIALPSNHRAVFPPRCVCCDLDHPQGVAKISVTGSTTGPSFTEIAIDAATGSTSRTASNIRVTLEPPACPRCAKALQRRHFWKTVLLYVGALGGVAVFGTLLMMGVSGWFAGLFIAAGVLGPVIWELTDPPAFTFTPSGGKITYEFKSESYAKDFADLNPTA